MLALGHDSEWFEEVSGLERGGFEVEVLGEGEELITRV
jgi:hypothetical protein